MDLKVMVYQLTGFPQEGASQSAGARQERSTCACPQVSSRRRRRPSCTSLAPCHWLRELPGPWHLIASKATTLKPEQLHAGSEENLRLIPPEQSVKKVTLLAMMSRSEGTRSQPAAPCMSRSGRFNTTQGIGGAVYLQAGAIRGRGRSKASAL